MTQTTIDNVDYIILYVPSGQFIEAEIQGPGISNPKVTGVASIKVQTQDQSIFITGSPKGVSLVQLSSSVVIITDKATAVTFWNPKLSLSYDMSPDVPSVLVAGPYLVRSASVTGDTLKLIGDINDVTPLTVIAPRAVKAITWNGKPLSMTDSPSGVGLTGVIVNTPYKPSLPNLKSLSWRSADSLPEIATNFDDSAWPTANKTVTARPEQPFSGKFVLYADEYGM